jgi:hypothetical protein
MSQSSSSESQQTSKSRSRSPSLELRLINVIDALPDLDPVSKAFLRGRWLDRVLFFEKAAVGNALGYKVTRLIVIISGVLTPTVTLMARGSPPDCALSLPSAAITFTSVLDWLVVALGLAVALSAAVEQVFRYGVQWRHYRRLAEHRKCEH